MTRRPGELGRRPVDSASEGRYDGPTLLDGLRACAGIPCRRSSVRDVHVHATAAVVNGDRDLGRIIRLDHRHLEYLHVTSLSHPCSTFDKHCLSVLRAFAYSLSVRAHTVRWTSAARRARSPSQCGATYPLRFPAIEVVLVCFIAESDLAARPASARTSIAAALSPPAPNTGVLLVEFDLAALRAAQDLELADRRTAVAAASSPIAALLSLLSPPPSSPALQSPSRPGCDGWLIDETTNPGSRYTRDEALPRRT
jgi:hypothetical protein